MTTSSRVERASRIAVALCSVGVGGCRAPDEATGAPSPLPTASGGAAWLTPPGVFGAGGNPGAPPAPGAAAGGLSNVGLGDTPPVPGIAPGGSAAAAGGAPPMPRDVEHDHCMFGYEPDPRDAQLTNQPDQWVSAGGEIDLVLPKLVLDWFGEQVWEQAHDAWHNVRRCRGGGLPGAFGGSTEVCSHTDLVPEHQECTDAEDGYAFLVTHRHMLQTLKQLFPQHADLFAGFPHFPYGAEDVPEEWRGRWGTGWSAQILSTARTLEDIENQLAQFATEGDLGRYIQCGGMANGASSIHGALHFKWVVNSSPHSLGKQTVNIDNYMFWKLHGWIDGIWERYRTAKGLTPDEPKLRQALDDQCYEMHRLSLLFDPSLSSRPDAPLPPEAGVFQETVRPIFEKICSGCHSESSPEAGMSLGGHISSADVVANVVNVQTVHGGQYRRVVPGSPEQSWLYLKVSGQALGAGCAATNCNNQVMPPTGQVTLTPAEIEAIRQWILAGAPAPTPL